MLEIISGYVVVNGVKFHYYRTGGNKPPLVLAHGITDDGLCWIPLAEVLAHDFDVVMVDARGHGKSDAPAGGYTLRNLGLELAGLIERLDLDKSFLLGHSMGAMTTLVLAGLFPDLPRAILLEDPPPFWMFTESDTRNDEFLNEFTAWITSLKRKTRSELLEEVRDQHPGWSGAELDPWVDAKHRFSFKISALIHPDDMISINFPELLSRIACPVLFISADPALGAASDGADITRIKEWIPHIQVAPVAHAGHSIRRDQFSSYLEVTQAFLYGLP